MTYVEEKKREGPRQLSPSLALRRYMKGARRKEEKARRRRKKVKPDRKFDSVGTEEFGEK